MSDPHGWRDRAACNGQPVDMFFPGRGDNWRHIRRVIRTWCVPCPVRAECLEDEMRQPVSKRVGIRGGVLFSAGQASARRIADPHGFLATGSAT